MSTVIQVEKLSKTYRLGTIGGGTLRDDVSRWLAKLRGKADPTSKIGQEHHARLVGQEFRALNGVSFEVKQGEILGIIGRNGAGKSTLLKILSRVTAPTSGEIRVKGRIASLLEVGTGFHPELSGRENIFLNGAILGMNKAEIKAKFDEIVAFSEVEDFIDTPVKRYSSGMYVRLAFAVAAHLEPEILIVDEVLAVGDAAFQKKCLGKMGDVARGGRTVLFVSHNMGVVSSLCQSALWLDGGQLRCTGEARLIVQDYLAKFASNFGNVPDLGAVPRDEHYGEKMRLVSLEWLTGYPLKHGHTIRLAMNCRATSDCEEVSAAIGFASLEGIRLLTYDSDLAGNARHKVSHGDLVRFEMEIPDLPVAPGIYNLDFGIRSGDMHQLDFLAGAMQVEVIPGEKTPGFIMRQGAGIRLPAQIRPAISAS